MSISYLSREVAADEEAGILLYFWNGSAWRVLDTVLDSERNEAAARVQGPGLYALMSSIAVPLPNAGWNLFAYSARQPRPVTTTLASIDGAYQLIYGYEPAHSADPWKVYAVAAPSWVNDLASLRPGSGYWIKTTRPITLYLNADAPAIPLAINPLPAPPATLYGLLVARSGFSPSPGIPVVARIGSLVCARAETRQIGSRVGFAIDVPASGDGATQGCGVPGAQIVVQVGTQTFNAVWDNGQVQELRQ